MMAEYSLNDPDMVGSQAAMYRAWRKALIQAKMHGVAVPEWRDGKVVMVPPDQIVIPPEQPADDAEKADS